jgi:Amt family ammonium transporter
MKNPKAGWIFLLIFLVAFAIMGVLFPAADLGVGDTNIVPGDVAWMLTATALVLLMTPVWPSFMAKGSA